MKCSLSVACLHGLLFLQSISSGCASRRHLKTGLGGKDDECINAYYTCPSPQNMDPSHAFGDHVAICNRGGGTISLVDPNTLESTEYELPDEGEPMYFGLSQAKSELWVGDRANNRLVIYRMKGCQVELDGYVDTPAGLFHSMITQRLDSEYPIVATTCDIDNKIVVHDLTTRRLLATLDPPQEAIDAGTKPHDITTNGDYIIATFLGGEEGSGFVACYDAIDFSLLSVLETEADPHVAIREETDLFVAAQGGNNPGFVIKASVPDLNVLSSVERPSPHGMFISFDSKYLYTTNIGGGGESAIDTWDVATGEQMDCPTVTTSNPVPHNPTVSFDGKMIYITHSGATSENNSAFSIGDDGCPDPSSERIFQTDENPFGLFVVPPAEPLIECRNED